MLKNINDPKALREAMLSLLPTAGTLAGIGVGLIGLVNSGPQGKRPTFADDMLLGSSLGFLLVCYLIFFAMRNLESPNTPRVVLAIDLIFLLALTLVVFSGFVVTYEFM